MRIGRSSCLTIGCTGSPINPAPGDPQRSARGDNGMKVQLPIVKFSQEQRLLWEHVGNLWAMSKERNENQIRATLHPRYVGWDMNAALPHNREAATQSVLGDAPALLEYDLRPLSVQIYEELVGVVHYSYSAKVLPRDGQALAVTGKWCEVYLKQDGRWMMVSVSGRPDEPTQLMPNNRVHATRYPRA